MVGERNDEKEKESVECMRPHDVARELGISRNTVIRLMREKKLPGFKVGKSWMIRRCDLESYLFDLAKAARSVRKEAV